MKYLNLFGKAIQHNAQQGRVLFRFRRANDEIRKWRKQVVPSRPFEQTCLIDMTKIRFDGEQGRRFFALVHLLTRGGYQVWMVPRLGFMQSAHKGYKQRALKNVRPSDSPDAPAEFDLCLTDRRSKDLRAKQTLRLTHHAHRKLRDLELPMPYSFHPDVLDALDERSLNELRETPKRWRVFFGGNLQQASYEKVRGYYHMHPVNRHDVLQEVVKHYADRTQSPTNAEEFQDLLSTDVDGFAFANSDIYRIPATQWLDALARGQFFIAAPGMNYPVSHNCVEAMAVGSIPVLEYNKLFQPHLVDGVNCLTYQGKAGLRETLARIDSMSALEIEKLRQGTIAYYDEHMSAEAFANRLRTTAKTQLHVFSYLTRPAA